MSTEGGCFYAPWRREPSWGAVTETEADRLADGGQDFIPLTHPTTEKPLGKLLSIAPLYLFTICLKSFMESDIALGKLPVKGKRKKYLLGNALVDKFGNILKSKFYVVFWMSHETAPLGI